MSLQIHRASSTQKLISRIAAANANGNVIDITNLTADGLGARVMPSNKIGSRIGIETGVVALPNSAGIENYKNLIGICPDNQTRVYVKEHTRGNSQVRATTYCKTSKAKNPNKVVENDYRAPVLIQNSNTSTPSKASKTIRPDSSGNCPEGMIRIDRDEYIRRGVVVKKSSFCVKDRGNKGKGPDVIGPLKKDGLGVFGYHAKIEGRIVSERVRHDALTEAVRELGKNNVVQKLNAVAVLQRNINPEVANIFEVDKQWVMTHF